MAMFGNGKGGYPIERILSQFGLMCVVCHEHCILTLTAGAASRQEKRHYGHVRKR